MPQEHPFRPHTQPPQSSRSTETPMDFTYDRAPSSSAYLSTDSTKPSSAPSNTHATRSLFQSNSSTSSPSPLTVSSPEPPRKRMHYETESMDWESCPATQPDPKPNLFPNPDSTRALGGTFLFNPPPSLPLPPVYTHPSSLPSLPSPTKFRPESYGLYPSPRNAHPEDNEADSSLDVEHVVLQPIQSSKMYSNNAVRHENRRRTRAQKQIRSKLSQLSFNSDDDPDSDIEVISNQDNKALVKKSKNRQTQDRALNKKRSEITTNNYLTINGWKGSEETSRRQNQSHLSTDTPYTLLVYLQLLFNASLVFGALYIAINIILNIRTDINHKFLVHTSKLRQEIELCTKEYNSNRCFPVDQRTKFIEKHCIEWESCMNRNPNLISRSKIAAETFAEAINGFVDMISWKTMLFIILSIGAGIYATNLAMNSYKSKWEPPHHRHHHQMKTSPWKPRFLSSSGDTKGHNDTIDPIEIFGHTSKIFSSNNNNNNTNDSDARKNR